MKNERVTDRGGGGRRRRRREEEEEEEMEEEGGNLPGSRERDAGELTHRLNT